MSYLIFHPSVAPHVQQSARSLHEAGQLERFVTSVRDNPEGVFQRSATALGRLAGRDLRAQFRRRAVTEIPADKVESHPFLEWARIGSVALDSSGRLGDFVWERTEKAFDRGVARRLPGTITGVYGFEHSSLSTFTEAKRRGLKVVYEVPAPETGFVHRMLAEETGKFPGMAPAHLERSFRFQERRTLRRKLEWGLADLVLVNSRFTRDSYLAAGLDCSRVRIVNLGAPEPAAGALEPPPAGGPLTLVWAGTLSLRKGAHYLLDAWRRGNLGRHAKLLVYGAVDLPQRALSPLPDGVELRGSVPRPVLFEQFLRSDALIFPTLCDGFGMVATEAWAHGLPVITTDKAGASDMLRPGENGLLVRSGDSAAILEAVEWCASHREELRSMRALAVATAARWQWGDYRREQARILRSEGLFGAGP